MGQFESGKWIIGTILYFFAFFILMMGVTNAAVNYNISTANINYKDPGFYNSNNDPLKQGGLCSGDINFFCGTLALVDNVSCEAVGCQWDTTNLFCYGIAATSECGVISNSTFCGLLGCTWTSYIEGGQPAVVNPSESFDWSGVRNTIGVMTGFTANIGMPAAWAFLFSFIFFWIPFFILLWASYMALPWVH